MPLPSDKSKKNTIEQLMVGEGDFSFARAYAEKHLNKAKKLVASELRSREEIIETYPGAEENLIRLEQLDVTLQFGIDATQLEKHFPNTRIKAIYFNAPHDGLDYKESPDSLSGLIAQFFASAKKVQENDDPIYLGIPKPSKSLGAFNQAFRYRLLDGCAAAGYCPKNPIRLTQAESDGGSRYPGYKPVYQDPAGKNRSYIGADTLRQYVFTLTALTAEAILAMCSPEFVSPEDPSGKKNHSCVVTSPQPCVSWPLTQELESQESQPSASPPPSKDSSFGSGSLVATQPWSLSNSPTEASAKEPMAPPRPRRASSSSWVSTQPWSASASLEEAVNTVMASPEDTPPDELQQQSRPPKLMRAANPSDPALFGGGAKRRPETSPLDANAPKPKRAAMK